jgi:hypothetical protein
VRSLAASDSSDTAHLQYHRPVRRQKMAMKTVSLKDGMPLVRESIQRLEAELHRARNEGVKVLKVIHGYGSKGVGGDIRIAVQKELMRLQSQGEVRSVIFGEDWRLSNEAAWAVLQRATELKRDADLGRQNQGITIVLL